MHLKLRKNPPWPKELDKGQRALGESQLFYFPFLFSHFFAAEKEFWEVQDRAERLNPQLAGQRPQEGPPWDLGVWAKPERRELKEWIPKAMPES